jgi:hypothetical protein
LEELVEPEEFLFKSEAGRVTLGRPLPEELPVLESLVLSFTLFTLVDEGSVRFVVVVVVVVVADLRPEFSLVVVAVSFPLRRKVMRFPVLVTSRRSPTVVLVAVFIVVAVLPRVVV